MTKFQQMIVLGLLREKPLHGYQMDQKIKSMAGTLAGGMATSTLYAQVKALERAGAIHRRDVTQVDKPDKKLYSISAGGISLFETLIRQVWTESGTDQAGACLFFLRYLPPVEVHNFLIMRMAQLQHVLNAQESLASMGAFTADFQALMIAPWERRMALAAADLQWVRTFYEDYFGQPAPEFELDQPITDVVASFLEVKGVVGEKEEEMASPQPEIPDNRPSSLLH